MGSCFAPNCKSGYGGKSTHLFRPSSIVSEQWVSIFAKLRADKIFNPKNPGHRVCHLHFPEENIIKTDDFVINGEKVSLLRERWTLKQEAIPTKFPSLPAYLQPTLPKKRRLLRRSETVNVVPPKRLKVITHSMHEPNLAIGISDDDLQQPVLHSFSIGKWWNENSSKYKDWTLYFADNQYHLMEIDITQHLPRIAKSITIKDEKIIKFGVNNEDYSEQLLELAGETVTDCSSAQNLLHHAKSLKRCSGVKGFHSVSLRNGATLVDKAWISKTCEVIGESIVCHQCKKLLPSLRNGFYRSQQSSMKKLTQSAKSSSSRRKLFYYKRRSTVLKKVACSFKAQVKNLQTTVSKLKLAVCEEQLKETGLHPNQQQVVLHLLQSIKRKATTGNRYSPEWLLECLLLKIKSPAAYHHLREAKLLPLPHVSTLRKLISGQKCEYGFSTGSLRAIQLQLKNKNRRDRQGSLIFDEVMLRETVEFNKSTNKFIGFEDFGPENRPQSNSGEQKYANHALVMMYRPLNSNWVQPIAAFATRNSAKGDMLAKLILQAIVKLKSVGAEVLSVVCDGAKTNKSMWKSFGIQGKGQNIVNKIQHPLDEDKWIFFSCDVPHLFKCVRNHFRKYDEVQFQDKKVKFRYYERLLQEDDKRSGGLRKCPKITKTHIWPNSFEKMVVPYCTQLFSRSVATGLEFYRNAKLPDFYGSEATQQFTLLLNDVFDALNAKIPRNGLKPNCESYKLLQRFLSMVNTEYQNNQKNSNYRLFASSETIEALRITLTTTLEIIDFLVLDLGYSYVLTVKLNQDCLEKFFGLIRAAGGREDHPTISNFIQLYRLLSIYSPCKRILRGNIRDESEVSVLCSFKSELRSTARNVLNERRAANEEIKNAIIKHYDLLNTDSKDVDLDELECDVLFPNPDCNGLDDSATLDKYIVFHLCGYLAFKGTKLFNCVDCVDTLRSTKDNCTEEFRYLTDLMNKGPLNYPSSQLFEIVVSGIEPLVVNMLKKSAFMGDVVLACVQKLPAFACKGIGCCVSGHQKQLLCQIIPYYIKMRFNFWCKMMKNKFSKGKGTRNKRKESKLLS